MSSKKPKVLIIGLDCLAPDLIFRRWKNDLPTFSKLMDAGIWGPLRSVDPPITVPAWTCMMSGFNAAQHGIFGFRHRKLGSYDKRYFALSDRVKLPRVWDHLTKAGFSSGLLAVPQTFPPKKLNGYSVSGFLAPSTEEVYTFPDKLRKEIQEVVGNYRLDVEHFRSDERDRIWADIQDMTTKRFKLLRHFVRTRPTDFTMVVEIGVDRIHHCFWRFFDETHHSHEPGHKYQNIVHDYYVSLDKELASILELLDDETHVFVVSDHGAKAMVGGFCINDWLRKRGLLKLKEEPQGPTKFDESNVDWSATKAWGWGGYYGRIFVNLEGREPNGQVPANRYESFLTELTQELAAIKDHEGKPMGNRALRPRELLPAGQELKGDYPDLMAYFGELRWRAVGQVGNPDVYTFENDTGPDDANHDFDGTIIYRPPGGHSKPGRREGLRLIDVGPTVLELFGLKTPDGAAGRPMELE